MSAASGGAFRTLSSIYDRTSSKVPSGIFDVVLKCLLEKAFGTAFFDHFSSLSDFHYLNS